MESPSAPKAPHASVALFDKSSQGDIVMSAYWDARAIRLVTLQSGQLVLYVSQLAGLLVAAWVMSPSSRHRSLVRSARSPGFCWDSSYRPWRAGAAGGRVTPDSYSR